MNPLLIHLCRFPVRAPVALLEGFLGSMELDNPLHPKDSRPLAPRSVCDPDLPRSPPERLDCLSQQTDALSSCVAPSLGRLRGGTGIFVPVSHRLRLSASA